MTTEVPMRLLRHTTMLLAALILSTAFSAGVEVRTETVVVGKPAAEAKATRLIIVSGQSNAGHIRLKPTLFKPFLEAFPDDELIFVKCAPGGRSIKMWYKDWVTLSGMPQDGIGSIYDVLMTEVRSATKGKKIASASLIWMQGETDALERRGAQAGIYQDCLSGLIAQFRADLEQPNMTAVIGRINVAHVGEAAWDTVRKAQVDVAEADANADWINTDDLEQNGLHFGGRSYRTMAQRFAEKTIALIRKED